MTEKEAVDITGMSNGELMRLQIQYRREHPNPYTVELHERAARLAAERVTERKIAEAGWELEKDTAGAQATGLSLDKYREVKAVVIPDYEEKISLFRF
jgi:hypothetical protein